MRRRAIFLSYRRADTADVVGRVNDALVVAFGESEVFRDVDSIPMGADFAAHIGETLNRCRVCLVFIGPDWLDARDEQGRRRLDDHRDLVRVEIETALETPKLLVVPVLVNGARMPSRESLPVTMRDLASLNAASMRRDPDFRADMARLVEALRKHLRTGKLDLSALGGAAAKAAGLSAAVAMSWGVLAGAVGVATVVPQVREPIVAASVGLFESPPRPEAPPAASAPSNEQQSASTVQVEQSEPQATAEPDAQVQPPQSAAPPRQREAPPVQSAAIEEVDAVLGRWVEYVGGGRRVVTFRRDGALLSHGSDGSTQAGTWRREGNSIMFTQNANNQEWAIWNDRDTGREITRLVVSYTALNTCRPSGGTMSCTWRYSAPPENCEISNEGRTMTCVAGEFSHTRNTRDSLFVRD